MPGATFNAPQPGWFTGKPSPRPLRPVIFRQSSAFQPKTRGLLVARIINGGQRRHNLDPHCVAFKQISIVQMEQGLPETPDYPASTLPMADPPPGSQPSMAQLNTGGTIFFNNCDETHGRTLLR